MKRIKTECPVYINCLLLLLICFFKPAPVLSQKNKEKYVSPVFGNDKEKKDKNRSFSIGYKGCLEAGVAANDLDYKKIQFGGGFTSHGVFLLNTIFLGLGVGIDNYDSLIMRPIAADLRVLVSSPNKSTKGTENSQQSYKPRKTNLFLFFTCGKSRTINGPLDYKPQGYMFHGGFGLLMGTQKYARATLTLGYKYQELKGVPNVNAVNNTQSIHLRLGVEFKS